MIHRTNVYDSVDKLVSKGVISFIVKDKKKYYNACAPETLRLLLNEKELAFRKMLPEFQLARQFSTQGSEAAIYKGVQAIHNMFIEFLEYNKPILVYGIPPQAPQMVKNFIMHYHKKRIAKKVVMKHIYNFNAVERITFLNTMPFTEAKALPQRYESSVSTFVCGSEVALVLWCENPWVIRIKNPQISSAYEKFFEILWKDAYIPK